MAEARVARVDVDDGHGRRELPLVAAAAVEVRPDPLDGAGVLVGAARAVERERRVRVVGVPDDMIGIISVGIFASRLTYQYRRGCENRTASTQPPLSISAVIT